MPKWSADALAPGQRTLGAWFTLRLRNEGDANSAMREPISPSPREEPSEPPHDIACQRDRDVPPSPAESSVYTIAGRREAYARYPPGTGCIYLIMNNANSKCYVGQTWNVVKRIQQHGSVGGGGAKLLSRSIKMRGSDAFSVTVLETASTQELLDAAETRHILRLGTLVPGGYNLTTGGEHPSLSDESRRKIGDAHRGVRPTEETRQRIRNALLGKKYAPGRTSHWLGKTPSQLTRDRLSRAHRARAASRVRPIYVFDARTHALVERFENSTAFAAAGGGNTTLTSWRIVHECQFKFRGIMCYMRRVPDPLQKRFERGRRVVVTRDDGVELRFASIVEARKTFGIGRGCLEQILAGKARTARARVHGVATRVTIRYDS